MKPIVVTVNRFIFGRRIIGMTIFPFIFMRKDSVNPVVINHESIHIRQQLETLIIGFYLMYLLFWIWNTITPIIPGGSYYRIPFEKEAYSNENNQNYLKTRKPFAWFKYI